MRTRPPALLAAALLASGCGPADAPATAPPPPQRGPNAKFAVEHDFGTVPHGEERRAEIAIPLPDTGGPWIPVGFRRSCSCAQHRFVVVSADGAERLVDGIGLSDPADAVPAGGSLRLRLTITTAEKEAADLEPTWTPGQVVLQEATSGARRELVPLRFRYGIDAPLTLKPFAHLDLADIPRPIRFAQSIRILPDATRTVSLGEPRCVETLDGVTIREPRDVQVELTPEDGGTWVLEVAIQPGEDRPEGPFALQVRIPTDLDDGYELRVPVSGTVVPGVRISPPGWIAFGAFPFDQQRECWVTVTDHHPDHSADFHVVGIVDNRGIDLREHFDARVEPVEHQVRRRTVHLSYDGALDARSFRGEVLLARQPDGPPALRIEFAGFDRK